MRAQTQLDFAIGMGVFLVVTAFVLSFVPGMLQPFESSNQQETVAANRVADQLVGGMLGSADEPYVLDRECTIAFFEDESADGTDADIGENTDGDGTFSNIYDDSPGFTGPCNFEDVSLHQRVGLDGTRMSLRVQLVRDLVTGEADNPNTGSDDDEVEPLCLDANDPRIIEAGDPIDDSDGDQCDIDSDDDDVVLVTGETPPSGTNSIVVARRTVSVSGGFADDTSDATLIVEVW